MLLTLCYLEGLDLLGSRVSNGSVDDLTSALSQSLGLNSNLAAYILPRDLRDSLGHAPTEEMSQNPSSHAPVMLEQLFITEKSLGRGSSGRVDLVQARCQYGDILEGEHYAIKYLECMSSQTYQERDLMRKVSHPCIVHFVEAMKTVYPYPSWALVLEYCHGGSLQDKVDREGEPGLPQPVVCRYAAETLDALSYLHRSGIMHRD